jgi:hypothetical protein
LKAHQYLERIDRIETIQRHHNARPTKMSVSRV